VFSQINEEGDGTARGRARNCCALRATFSAPGKDLLVPLDAALLGRGKNISFYRVKRKRDFLFVSFLTFLPKVRNQ